MLVIKESNEHLGIEIFHHMSSPEEGEADSATTAEAEESNNTSRSGNLQRFQSLSTTASFILSPVAIILVSVWVSKLGGVSWSEGNAKTVFNWHPVLMIVAFR